MIIGINTMNDLLLFFDDLIRLKYMRGKKLVNINQINNHPHTKVENTRPIIKRRINQVRSLEHKYKVQPITQPNTEKIIKMPTNNITSDYQFQRQPQQTLNYVPIESNHLIQGKNIDNRFQRNTNTNNVIAKTRQNNFISYNESMNSSTQKIKIVSVENKDKSLSRSENNSAKKRGIQLTKTLLKRISGMYADKDFQKKSSYVKSNKDETTGIMTMTMSGRGVYDQYQLSDFDFQAVGNHTFNNSISFNDSGSWNRSNQLINNESNIANSQNNQNNSQRYCPERKIQYPHLTPKAQLSKAKSYDLISQPLTQSFTVGGQPPSKPTISRRGQANINQQQNERYLIRSKNKTMDQLSIKESMVFGFDNYYQ